MYNIEYWSIVILNKYSLRVAPLQLGWSIHGTYIGMVDCNNRQLTDNHLGWSAGELSL